MRLAIAGLGTVGAATVGLLQTQAELLAARAGQELRLVAVSARSKNKERGCDLDGIDWVDDALELARRADVDVVVELMGGAEGAARALAEAALANGKHLVTANKALIAAHGRDLAVVAEKAGLQLSFEAAVCGGLPVIKTLREGLAANSVQSLRGILNGTCNYILTRMAAEGAPFDEVLADAQKLGFAEADPSADIDGPDTANKLAILTAIAFGQAPDLDAIFVEGIRAVSPDDLRDAAEKGGAIKLVAVAERTPHGVVQRVQPAFIPFEESLARIDGVLNAVEIAGDFVGEIAMIGRGAGGEATASAVVADLVDLARGVRRPAFGIAADMLE